jgi:hypothetical protein
MSKNKNLVTSMLTYVVLCILLPIFTHNARLTSEALSWHGCCECKNHDSSRIWLNRLLSILAFFYFSVFGHTACAIRFNFILF